MSSIRILIVLLVLWFSVDTIAGQTYTIVDTGQIRCYNNSTEIEYPKTGSAFFGQDAQYAGNQPSYTLSADGLTVYDNVTRLTWMQSPDTNLDGTITYADKLSWTDAQAVPAALNAINYGGYSDWRLPSIKELYSLIDFGGTDTPPHASTGTTPFINTDYFGFSYGFISEGERIIDSQWATSTKYVSTTMGGNETMFGVNFADGRIKGYPAADHIGKKYCVICVRGNPAYGKNDFHDNGDGTITDRATGLMWTKADSGHLKAGVNKDGKLDWVQALERAENLEYAGYSDWRLPNAKELQSIVDYSRCPDATNSAAIDPVFEVTSIINEGGKKDYPFYWTSTSHCGRGTEAAAYIAFGRSLGWMQDRRTSQRQLLDVHGAGSQRSDPKTGNPSQFPYGRGPQGDVIRIYNYVRCVRGGKAKSNTIGPKIEMNHTSQRPQFNAMPTEQAGRRGPQGSQPRFGPMGGPMGEWFENLTKAYEQKNMDKIGQLIDDMKQRRQRGMVRPGWGMRPGQGRPTPGRTGVSAIESVLLPKTEAEKKIVNVLDDMDKNQSRGMMNVPREDGRLLRLFTEAAGAKHVVEIGTSNGYSGIWFCLALRTTGGKLTTHEIDNYRASLARENFKRAGVDKLVTIVMGDAHETVKKLNEPIDVLFLDADKEGYTDYLNKLLPLVRPGGLILAHNAESTGQDFIDAVTTNPNLETIFQVQGLGVTLKKRQSK